MRKHSCLLNSNSSVPQLGIQFPYLGCSYSAYLLSTSGSQDGFQLPKLPNYLVYHGEDSLSEESSWIWFHQEDFKFRRLKSSYSKIEDRDLQSQAISLSLEIEQDMSRRPSTEEVKGIASQSLPKKSLAIYQEPEALHLKPVNDMVFARNKSFCLKLPVFEQFSTSKLPSRSEKVSRPKSVFTSSTLGTSSVLYGIMSSLLEDCVQEKSLTYPIKELSV